MRHNLCFTCATCLLSACDTFAFDTRIQNIRIVTSHAVHSAYDTRITYILCTVCETYKNITCASNATNEQHSLFRMRNISCSSCESRMRNTLCCMRNISYARLICECLVCVASAVFTIAAEPPPACEMLVESDEASRSKWLALLHRFNHKRYWFNKQYGTAYNPPIWRWVDNDT